MYDFKKAQELFWFLATAAVLAIAQILVTFEPEKVLDWKTYAIALIGAAVRAIAGALLTRAPKPSGE